MAKHIASLALSAGYVVLSGGAEGIDSAVHEGALVCGENMAMQSRRSAACMPMAGREARPAVDGRTIAVLGGGLAAFAKNLSFARGVLFKRIVADGLLISEYPPQTPARTFHFVRRNSILAALAAHVFVVQAPRRSGTLITAAWARALKKEVSVCLWPPDLAEGEGGAGLYGEDVCYTADGSGFLRQEIPYIPLADLFSRSEKNGSMNEDQKKVYFALLGGERGLADLVHACGLAPERALAALTRLEIDGWVENAGDRMYSLVHAA
jgi:DNA processing protein